ncbi:MAG: hypothetical protein R2771_14225 [Saprospiraceae bacterium]
MTNDSVDKIIRLLMDIITISLMIVIFIDKYQENKIKYQEKNNQIEMMTEIERPMNTQENIIKYRKSYNDKRKEIIIKTED